uniref:TIL domain-containing protein n=1 Tax=Panagrolaimus sp. PS1159 TaxID=55785 RepID=A0AC35GEJ6_9BILA
MRFIWIFVLIASVIAFANAQKCGPNEKWAECASACEASCSQPEDMMCIQMCMPAKCQCVQGTARNSQGKCVPRSKC